VAVPIVIFAVCLLAGVFASSRWLPDLAQGVAGGSAYFAVCGLLGAALGVIGLRLYLIVEDLEHVGGLFRRQTVAIGLDSMLWESGLLLGLAMAVYLLAPAAPVASGDTTAGS
jgi:hypothetical protein